MTAPPPPPETREDPLLAYLREHEARCPACGYNLHRLISPACPECGLELKLTVGATEPYLRAWFTLAVPTLLMAGLGIFFIVMIDRQGWPKGGMSRWQLIITNAFIVYAMLCIPLGAAVLGLRKPFLRLPGRWQWSIAVLGAVVPATAFLGFVTTIP